MAQVETPTPAAVATKAVANPGPLGLMGFGLTTLVLSLANSNLFGTGGINGAAALPLALAFGGGAQLLAGMWEFHAGNTFGATAFTSYGAFWISFYFLLNNGFAANAGMYGVAAYLLGWTIFTFVMLLGALRVNVVTGSLFALLFLTFLGLTIGAFIGGGGGDGSLFNHIGGYLGIVTALNAFYNAAAGVLKDVSGGKDVLPVFPISR